MSFQQLLLVFALVTVACNVFALDNGLGATRKCSALVVPPTLSLDQASIPIVFSDFLLPLSILRCQLRWVGLAGMSTRAASTNRRL